MKRSEKLYFFFLITLFLLPQINFAVADEKPDYVGIDVNDVFIWKVTIDEDPFEDFLEDAGYTDEEIDADIDLIFDDLWDEDVEGWKLVILDIKDEKDFKYNYSGTEENDQVPYLFNLYITEDYDQKDWDEEETNERGGIAKYDRDFYVYRTNEMMGLYYWIVANNINWKRVVDEADEEFDDNWDGPDEDAGARVAKTLYKENGISTFWNPDEDEFDDFEATSQYNDDGVLMYYEWSYDGDPIIILELEGKFFYEYWEIILGVAIAGVAVVVLIVVIIKRRGSLLWKKKDIFTKKPERVDDQFEQATQSLNYCPNCGKVVTGAFCSQCGLKVN